MKMRAVHRVDVERFVQIRFVVPVDVDQSSDLVTAFQNGGFDAGPRAIMAVPEPSISLLGIGLAILFVTKWTYRSRHTG